MKIGYVSCANLPEPDPDADFLIETTSRAGVLGHIVPWDRPREDWGSFDALVLRSCWNYHWHSNEFLAWLVEVESQTRVLNPPQVVRWNLEKTYLRVLASAGIPVVETEFVPQGASLDLDGLCSGRRWGRFVVKPTISAGSWKTRVFDAETLAEGQALLDGLVRERGAMVQPFLESVRSVGERSVVAIGEEATHVVAKLPRFDGDDEGVSDAVSPTDLERSLLAECLATVGSQDICYSRLDLIQGADGGWLVSELELIEPSLFLLQHPPAAEKLVSRILSG